jgi:hypothetical protein
LISSEGRDVDEPELDEVNAFATFKVVQYPILQASGGIS